LGRKAVVAEEFNLDSIDLVCMSLELNEEQCALVREAAEAICTKKRGKKKKREPSEYQKFTSECLTKEIPIEGSAPQAMKKCARTWRSEKEKRGLT